MTDKEDNIGSKDKDNNLSEIDQLVQDLVDMGETELASKLKLDEITHAIPKPGKKTYIHDKSVVFDETWQSKRPTIQKGWSSTLGKVYKQHINGETRIYMEPPQRRLRI